MKAERSLGDGFTGVPLQEIRLALTKGLVDGRWQLSVNGQLNNGYTGQTLETLAVGNEAVALSVQLAFLSGLTRQFRRLFLWSLI